MTRQEQILEALRTHGPMTSRQIQTLSEESLDKDSIDLSGWPYQSVLVECPQPAPMTCRRAPHDPLGIR